MERKKSRGDHQKCMAMQDVFPSSHSADSALFDDGRICCACDSKLVAFEAFARALLQLTE